MILICKIFGSVALLASSLVAANSLNREETKQFEILSDTIVLLKFIKTEIELYSLPIGAIFEKCDKKLLTACGFTEKPSDIEDFFNFCPLRDDALKSVKRFCDDFGCLSVVEQIKSCEACIFELSEIKKEKEETVKNNKKLNTTICTSIAIGVLILII